MVLGHGEGSCSPEARSMQLRRKGGEGIDTEHGIGSPQEYHAKFFGGWKEPGNINIPTALLIPIDSHGNKAVRRRVQARRARNAQKKDDFTAMSGHHEKPLVRRYWRWLLPEIRVASLSKQNTSFLTINTFALTQTHTLKQTFFKKTPPIYNMAQRGGQFCNVQRAGGQFCNVQRAGGQFCTVQRAGGQFCTVQRAGGQFCTVQRAGGQFCTVQRS
ncbi:hypothetical protein MBM_07939 [Drepanopeziza brunnea f. sp. 'multigermtubi' MB_m1]|uniref:Uncharacterized protein n=1 Tax=Marssonina brunnea f. sp. multigermtubi (strain MB_m1) TaxID=1072389 RepID=K1WYP5_MARBU|nr:uncharacterized protein MBM_07939 [Drepanopeziza brunnea f. sp. 'multigermtubi' MB_m1]EKD13738.1 hypothetical protein MBM_07939 [Drepanopeziza brunnea f. sp. 'multigermtubi' MB_m1]